MDIILIEKELFYMAVPLKMPGTGCSTGANGWTA